MGTNGHLYLDMSDTSVDQKVYHSIIESLFYLCASRPDIMVSLCMCTRFQTKPKDCHLRVIKRIMRYLVLTPNLDLWYHKGSHFELIGYSDADYAGCKVDRKCTFGTYQFLTLSLVSRSSMKQNYVALSTIEAKYISAGSYCAQLLWMRQTLRDYGYTINHIPILCDNESTIKIVYKPCKHSITKHRHPTPLFERPCHKRGCCYLTC
jgi:hypothetical protein